MEKWQVIFMILSGIYLIFLGMVMVKHKNVSMRKVIGIYNLVVGVLSIGGGIIGYFIKTIGSKIFFGFTIILIVSFVIFNILKAVERKS